jgi:hypothetical protein
MPLEKPQAVELIVSRRHWGDRIDGWRLCWASGWDKGRVLFVVMADSDGRRSSEHLGELG